MRESFVDLVTRRPDGAFVLTLIVQGPWGGDYSFELQALQDRLYNCVDIAIDGLLAEKFKDSVGRHVLIRVDAYGTPSGVVSEFVERFSGHISGSEEYQLAVRDNNFISSLEIVSYEA